MSIDLTQPGIYNALDSAYAMGMAIGPGFAVQNQQALQAAVNAAVADGGGVVLIPATDTGKDDTGPYQIECPASSPAAIVIPSGEMTQPLVICGTGNGTKLSMINSGDLFQINGNPWVTFQDLTVTYNQTTEHPLTGTAFSFNAGSGSEPPPNMGYRLFRLHIEDCQYPVAFNGNPSIATMRECAIFYGSSYPPDQETTCITISGGPVVIDGCIMLYHASANSQATTGIAIVNADADTVTSDVAVRNTHVQALQTGISISASAGSVAGVTFDNLNVAAPEIVVDIQGTVSDVTFCNSHFENGGAATGGNPGILVGTIGQSNDEIDTVRFEGCTVSGILGNGLEIQAGQNISVVGGTYSGNGYNGNAGIAITGAAAQIQLDGVNCVGPIYNGTAQQYGIAIYAGQNILITGANCSGNGFGVSSSTSYPGVGILIEGSDTATPSGIRIVGAICVGSVFGNDSEQQAGISVSGAEDVYVQRCTLTGSVTDTGCGASVSDSVGVFIDDCDLGANPYALSVTNDCQNVYVCRCNFNGSGTAALYTSSPGTLQIVNSPGYNDQGTPLGAIPSSGSPFNSVSFSYYGPMAFYVVGTATAPVSQIIVDGAITHLASGGFTLSAPAPDGGTYRGATAAISYGSTPPHFFAVGK